jgi:hypothetical protein
VARKIYTDQEINELVLELKPLPVDWRSVSRVKKTDSNITQIVDCIGSDKHRFQLQLRQNTSNPLNFCVTLGFFPEGSNELFRLRRYDGKYHEHSNPIEKVRRFYDFHIHIATERYQQFGTKEEDKYAVVTDRYSNYEGALKCLFKDCNFQVPQDPQLNLV